ncbi:MAG: hypothetical protein AAGA60_29900 [Cyanobacteria bacterium P01_E01_bin.42]
MIYCTLELFGAVSCSDNPSQSSEILEDYGILIHESAQAYRDEIVDFVKERCLSGKQLNSTFHKSWEKVKKASDCQLVLEQMLHYLSTYGVRFLESAWGVDLQIPVYLPN